MDLMLLSFVTLAKFAFICLIPARCAFVGQIFLLYCACVSRTLATWPFGGLILANASMALALSAHTPWVQLVSHDSACWLTGLGFRHT